MAIRRTTLAAEQDDLAVLEADAKRRGVSLAQVLREAVSHEAHQLRRRNRPRFGVSASSDGAAQAAERDEDAPLRGGRGR
jgi:uncharacterized membrane protein